MIMNNEKMQKIVENLKGKELTYSFINKELKKMGFEKLPDVTIQNGYYIDNNKGWVTLKILQNSVRITLNNNNIVL